MVYETYDEMDSVLGKLHSPSLEKDETMVLGPFGVFEGVKYTRVRRGRKREGEKAGGERAAQKVKVKEETGSGNKSTTPNINGDIALLSGAATSLVIASDAALRKAQSTEEIGAGGVSLEDSPITESIAGSIAESISSLTQGRGDRAPIIPYIPSEKAEYEALHEELSTLLSFPNDDIFSSGYFDAPNVYGDVTDPIADPTPFLNGETIEQHLQQLHSTIPRSQTQTQSEVLITNTDLAGTSTSGTSLLFIPTNTINQFGQLKYTLNDPSMSIPASPLFSFSPQAQYLLDYYDQNVIKIMTVVAHPKNPWRTIYLPRAYSAIGDTIGRGHTSAARNALLHALLAVSAFHIQRKFSAESDARQHYLSLGLRLKSEAYKWLSKCLVDDLQNQKYKDVVTAVLSMVTIDVIWGGMADCQIHLAACQSVVRLRHKTRELTSRKAMILQRISGFLTLLQRSTVVDSDSVLGFADEDEDDEDEKYNDEWMDIRLEDLELSSPTATTVKTTTSTTTTTATTTATSPNMAQSSLSYMRDPSQFQEYWHQYSIENAQTLSDDFYAKELVSTQSLYGIPDSLILLFNEACKRSRQGLYYRSKGERFPPSFSYKCKELESALVNWQTRYDINKTTNFTGQVKEALNHHTLAFHQALIIYHYRLARDVNPSALRSHVLAVLDHLEKMHQINMTHPEPLIIPLLFPVFMAACETTNASDMARFNAILDQMTVEGLGTYYTAMKVIAEVWKRREGNIPHADWWSVLREWKANIMLS